MIDESHEMPNRKVLDVLRCGVYVCCDEAKCVAVDDPQTPEEYQSAYLHWRYHHVEGGCSHGN